MNDEIKKAVSILKTGGIVAYPTDTLFGIGCDITNNQAVKKLIKLKRRDKKPISIACSNLEMVDKYTDINKEEAEIIQKYLPGPFTFILNKKEMVSELITAETEKVGVRIPDYPKILKIISLLGRPIISTSANFAGEPNIENLDQLKFEVDLKISGECKYKGGSTVVDLRARKILREGVRFDEIRELFCNI